MVSQSVPFVLPLPRAVSIIIVCPSAWREFTISILSVNGSAFFAVTFSQTSKFAFGESNSSGTACYTGGNLDETDGKWKTAELKFDTPSEVNNITSFQLQFVGIVPFDFEINDISISYRTKNVK